MCHCVHICVQTLNKSVRKDICFCSHLTKVSFINNKCFIYNVYCTWLRGSLCADDIRVRPSRFAARSRLSLLWLSTQESKSLSLICPA